MGAKNIMKELIKGNKFKLFASPYYWLLLKVQKSDVSVEHLKTFFAQLNILVDSEVVVINAYTKKVYTITKLFKFRLDQPFLEHKFGYWKPGGFVPNSALTSSTIRQRMDLNRTILKSCMVITNNSSLNHLEDKRDRHIDTISKVNYVLVQHLGDILNAKIEFSIQSTWGYKGNDSQWNGMIGELQRNKADIGGTALFMTSDRVPVIDYIAMTTPTRSKFVFRQPRLSYVANVYALPFHWTVWVSSFILLSVTTVVLYLTTKWEWVKKRHAQEASENANSESELQHSWSDITTLSVSAMCQQGTSFVPYGVAGRIITIMLYISLMFLYTSYSANIVALLQSSANSIITLGDLLHSRLDVGIDDTVFNRFYFPNATESIRREIYLRKVAPPGQVPNFFHINDGVNKMRYGHFAFHMETGAGYKIVIETFEEHEKCGLQEIEYLQVSDPWLAVQKNTPFKEMFKIGLRKIHERGIQAREISLLYTKKPSCTSRRNSFISVSIMDCYLAAAILCGGIILSLGVLLIEICIRYRSFFENNVYPVT